MALVIIGMLTIVATVIFAAFNMNRESDYYSFDRIYKRHMIAAVVHLGGWLLVIFGAITILA